MRWWRRTPAAPAKPITVQLELEDLLGCRSRDPRDEQLGRTCRPPPERFWGASIRLFQVDVLVVHVSLRVIGDWLEAPLVVAAFQSRFRRTIVLVAQDRHGVPMYFGPAAIARVLGRIPFGALAWQRYRYSTPRPPMLPIPVDPPEQPWSDSNNGVMSYLPTVIRDRDQAATRR